MNPKWEENLHRVAAMQQEAAKQGTPLWYRGQRDATWPLRSKLHRRVIEYFSKTGVRFGEVEDRVFLKDEYKSLYQKFKAQAWHLLDPMERNDWGIVFRMQHYGFATRLLDWTKSFACAIYFAQLGHFEYFPDLEGLRASYQTDMDTSIEHARNIISPPNGDES